MIIEAIAFWLLYLYLFWAVYILVMGVYRAYLTNSLPIFVKVLAAPMIIAGLAIDYFANWTIATAIFMQFPQSIKELVTDRLARYKSEDKGWRGKFAGFVCRNFLDMFDPNGIHCKPR